MLSLFRPKLLNLLIDRGRVACPQRGDIDIDVCAGCESLVRFDDKASPPVICCRGEPPRLEVLEARIGS